MKEQEITKREYFAAKAMEGLLAGGFNIYDDAVEMAVTFADDLIKELEK